MFFTNHMMILKPFFAFSQTKELTQSVGMESERELLTMLTFYHDLGNVVYYGGIEDQQSLLRDMVILNPQWLIDVFKQVITILDPAKRVRNSPPLQPHSLLLQWAAANLFWYNEMNGKWAFKTKSLYHKGPMQSVIQDIVGEHVANWCIQAGHYHWILQKGWETFPSIYNNILGLYRA